jgi:hypothetical protein
MARHKSKHIASRPARKDPELAPAQLKVKGSETCPHLMGEYHKITRPGEKVRLLISELRNLLIIMPPTLN